MTRCQLRAIRQLRELHTAYNKHDYQVVGQPRWGYEPDPVYMCNCGEFAARDDEDQVTPVKPNTCGAWVMRAYQSMGNKDKELFKAYLKRIDWEADTKKAAHLIYGSKGRSMWQLRYGIYLTKAEHEKAMEDES